MVERHHRLNGHEFDQALGDGEGQGSLACGSPWGRKELDTTEQLSLHSYTISEPNCGVQHVGSQFPDQGSNQSPLHWKTDS